MEIGNIKIGMSQIANPSSPILKTVANTVIIGSAIVSLVIAPMPTDWIPNDLRVYLLTVAASSSGFLKVLEKLSGQSAPVNTEVATEGK